MKLFHNSKVPIVPIISFVRMIISFFYSLKPADLFGKGTQEAALDIKLHQAAVLYHETSPLVHYATLPTYST